MGCVAGPRARDHPRPVHRPEAITRPPCRAGRPRRGERHRRGEAPRHPVRAAIRRATTRRGGARRLPFRAAPAPASGCREVRAHAGSITAPRARNAGGASWAAGSGQMLPFMPVRHTQHDTRVSCWSFMTWRSARQARPPQADLVGISGQPHTAVARGSPLRQVRIGSPGRMTLTSMRSRYIEPGAAGGRARRPHPRPRPGSVRPATNGKASTLAPGSGPWRTSSTAPSA